MDETTATSAEHAKLLLADGWEFAHKDPVANVVGARMIKSQPMNTEQGELMSWGEVEACEAETLRDQPMIHVRAETVFRLCQIAKAHYAQAAEIERLKAERDELQRRLFSSSMQEIIDAAYEQGAEDMRSRAIELAKAKTDTNPITGEKEILHLSTRSFLRLLKDLPTQPEDTNI